MDSGELTGFSLPRPLRSLRRIPGQPVRLAGPGGLPR